MKIFPSSTSWSRGQTSPSEPCGRPLTAKLAALLVAMILPICLPLTAQPSSDVPQPPPFFAIKDARVVTVAGGTLERATVLVADGMIEAIGADLPIPDDAWVIEGEGLVLYPGLIDAMTHRAQEKQREAASSSDSSNPFAALANAPVIRGPEDRPKTTPWVKAADSLDPESDDLEKWREAGFTTIVTSPKDGFFAGQAAVINLAGREPGDMVVKTPVAHRLNLEAGGGFGTFPGSLMGVIAYMRQVFSDAEHYGSARALYEDDPRGRNRVRYDRTLDPIHLAMRNGTPFLVEANIGREIDRVLSLAGEFDLNPIIVGAQGAYDRTDSLKQAAVPVVIDLDWPEEAKDRNPDADTDFRDLYHRRMAPTTPARLFAEEIPFAFTSGSLSSPDKVFEKLRVAVEAGLDDEAALEALTLGAAEILGVDDRLGSVTVGKIANLVLASDLPWVEDSEIAAVFVDGHRFQKREDDEEDSAPPEADPSGTWTLTADTPRGSQEMTGTFEMDDSGSVSGKLVSQMGELDIDDGKVSGSKLTFATTMEMGGNSFEATYALELAEDALEGSMSAGPMSFEITGERTAQAASSETAESDGEEDAEPAVTLAELQQVMDLYQAKAAELDTYAITNVTVWTLAEGETEPVSGATVVVEDGKIKAVGKDVRIPRNAETFDGEGGHLIPGIIDAHSHIAIEGGVNEGSLAVTAMVGIGDVVHPDDINIYRALAGGVTSANLLHGSANPIGGRNEVIKLRWGQGSEGMKFEGAPSGIKFALGENPKRSRSFGPIPPRYPATRMGVMDVIRQNFSDALEYQKRWQRYEQALNRGDKPTPPRVDYKLQTLVEILEGERMVHSHCYRADEILQLLRLAEEFGFKIQTLQHVLEGYKVANEIAEHGAGASTFSDWWGYKVEAYDAIPHNAALMTERGILVSINSDSAEEMRHLNQEAAKSIKWGGMSEVEALKLVTLNPAKQLGIDQRVGSIEVGKDADLVLYDSHPLTVRAIVQKTFIDGDLYFDIEHDRERQAAVDGLKAKMLDKDSDDEGEDDGATDTTPSTTATPAETNPASSNDSVRESFFDNPNRYSCRESH